uniref:2-aminoethanethiol dioxygenase n=2 Tax=Ixodes ricinus TaxID=34613 RepID=A0A6B0V3L3_IXORI
MAALIQAVARQAQATFTRSFLADEAFSDCLARLQRAASQITCKDVNLDEKMLHSISRATSYNGSDAAPVTYISLSENRTFTMSIFIVKRGARIPLHDHPSMYGILKVLYGSAKITSYSAIGRRTDAVTDELIVDAQRHPDVSVGAESNACCLTPTERNIHEIAAVDGPVAFLDILAPPYNMKDRDCHYYRVARESRHHQGSSDVQLVEVPTPHDFWCDAAPYSGPPITLTETES